MTIFELIQREVTAKQAAEMYGLRIDRNGRGFCPWHDDGRHAALQFFDNGLCYCHSCHEHGDATNLTAQMLGLTQKEAAEQIRRDFGLNGTVSARPSRAAKLSREARKAARDAFTARWCHLCDVVHEADAKLAQYTPETADTEFDMILAARCRANEELDIMWEESRYERA